MAPLGNTGDGILMASKVGAALWHMWHVHGTYGFKYPGFPLAFRHFADGSREPYEYRPYYFKMPWIVVDRNGKRFMNEYHPAPQDTNHRPLAYFDPDILDYPRIPCYLIFDEAARKERAIAKPLGMREFAYEWSKDNSLEIEKGWILQAGTIEDLAGMIHVNAKALKTTVQTWNRSVERGEDHEFGRPGGTMFASIDTPPFYAMESWPTLTNTQGGPAHNEKQQIVDFSGKPVSRLYACGELGSMFGHLYELAGNLGECISSGRIAGRFAVEENSLG
jgi:succinate dehydrogenase/fumarate reductase flavoprotein subunit